MSTASGSENKPLGWFSCNRVLPLLILLAVKDIAPSLLGNSPVPRGQMRAANWPFPTLRICSGCVCTKSSGSTIFYCTWGSTQ